MILFTSHRVIRFHQTSLFLSRQYYSHSPTLYCSWPSFLSQPYSSTHTTSPSLNISVPTYSLFQHLQLCAISSILFPLLRSISHTPFIYQPLLVLHSSSSSSSLFPSTLHILISPFISLASSSPFIIIRPPKTPWVQNATFLEPWPSPCTSSRGPQP